MDENQAFNQFKELLAGEPPELGPGPRAGVWPAKVIDTKLEDLFASHKVPGRNHKLIRGLALLWHNHHEPAHAIAQDDPSPDGSLLHAILHRREPDYGNAAYWFRRVGKHPCFPAITKRVTELLEEKKENGLLKQLIRSGEWDAFAFINACEEANRVAAPDPRVLLLRQIQAFESEALMEDLVTI